jgi:branched-chain amino acid transport system substrate-binding protein
MPPKWLLISILAGAIASSSACKANRGSASGTVVYKIGVLTPLTGGEANYGRSTKRGADLAVQQANSQLAPSQPRFELVYEDDQMNPTVGTSAIQKLVTVDRVPIILGPFGSSVVMAVAPIANRSHTIIMSASATADDIADAGDYVFRTVPPNRRQALDIAQFLRNTLKVTTASVLFLNIDYGVTLRDAFIPAFERLGGRVVSVDSFEAGATDFRTQLTRLKRAAPAAVFFPDHYKETALILKQARELGVSGPFIGGDGACTEDMLRLAGPAVEGSYFANMSTVSRNTKDSRVLAFLSVYRDKYHDAPDVYSIYAYDAMMIITNAILGAGYSADPIKNYLYGMPPYNGLAGTTKFDSRGEVDKSFSIYQVRNGEFVPIN